MYRLFYWIRTNLYRGIVQLMDGLRIGKVNFMYTYFVQVMYRLCKCYVLVKFKICTGDVLVMDRLYKGAEQVMYILFTGYVQVSHRLCTF